MRGIAFVVVLFAMAAAALLLGLVEPSLGWFVGGLVLLAVAFLARKLLREQVATTERAGPSSRFAVAAMAVTLVVLVFLFWLQSR